METKQLMQQAICWVRDAERLTGLSRVTLWRLETAGKFPRKKRYGNRGGYDLREVMAWIDDPDAGRRS